MPNTKKTTTTTKKPKQLRSRQIVRAIVLACRKIMDEEGAEALNTNRIAEVAGVNIASLYRWFPNKEAIIKETFEEQVAAEIDVVVNLYEEYVSHGNTSLKESFGMLIIDPLISRQIRFLSMHACFYKDHQPNFDVGQRKYGDRGNSLIEEASLWLAGALYQQQSGLSVEECEQRAFIATRTALGLCLAAATDRPDWLRQPGFRQEILNLVMPYLEGHN